MEVYAAGAIAAFTVDVLVYPLDTIKTRYQSQDYIQTYASSSAKKGPVLRGLYQGIGSVVLATLPAAGLFFSTYESAKRVIGNATPLPEPLVHSSASAVAEMASCMVLAPAEVIKQNAQMLQKESRGASHAGSSTSLQAFRQLAGAGASRRLFTGYTALVARNLPFTALQFPIFEHVRARVWKSRSDGRPEPTLVETGLVTGLSAGGAGSVAAFLTTPSDVVKTRMMLSAGSQHDSPAQGQSEVAAKVAGKRAKKGAWTVTQEVYRERGLRGFFRGAALRSGWTMLGSGLYLGTYEMSKVWLKRRKPELEDVGEL
ncbi:PET8 member of the mitochondrial carrier (MCF) family [Fusarium albosuccineum]|uniref:PET8 member of the mitochondrial carrier (MCF) family n=1 Tax=Fusarium albosuccineum TaxID=1237068 RepID=A0A8H4PM87_9HYPO|nr:PET8 member of the mitochondrial carrier (MCF) family [Fusarium albosuccineum]